MSRRTFWPGLNWRVLAHNREEPLRDGYSSGSWDMFAGPRWQGNEPFLEGHWELDELVIDDWFHIEQMDTRVWWMRVGNQDEGSKVLWVTIDGKGVAQVRVYDE